MYQFAIRCMAAGVLLSVFAPPLASAADGEKVFRAGAATSNITPPLGGLIVGGFHPYPSTHVHDELHARCLVLDNGEARVGVVVCDLLGAARQVFDEARRLVADETKMPPENLIISATHTHSATSALGNNRYKIDEPLDDYQRFVARRIADGVRRAINNLAPAKIGWGVGSEPRHVFNRRWFMKPGKVPVNPFGEFDQVKMNPPRASADLDRPAGPTDPEISLLSLQTTEGRPIAVLANYSLHYVGGVPEGHVSADYFPLFGDHLRQLIGGEPSDPPFVAMLSNGTSGNINNIDFKSPGTRQPPYSRMKEVARDVAAAAHVAYQKIQYQPWVRLGGRFSEFPVATRRPTPEQLERAKKIVANIKPNGPKTTLEEVYAQRTLGMNEYPTTVSLPLQVLRIGDVGISGIPHEVFVETGLELKEKVPFKPAFTISIANGYFGYLPTPEHHRLGGYETWLGTNRVEIDASTKIVAELLRMFETLK